MDLSFSGLVVVAAVALAAPLAIGLVPGLRLPSAVLEIVAGIVVGPAVLGWAEMDDVIRVFSLFGLAFLLFLAGLEIDFDRLRGRPLRLASAAFAVSLAIALAVGAALAATGQVEDGLIVAIILSATSLGVVVPVLKDAGEAGSPFGQLLIAAASIADFATIILLTLFFSREATGRGPSCCCWPGSSWRAPSPSPACWGWSAGGGCRRLWSACRTPPPRCACAGRSCCWRGSSRSPSASAWR